MSLDIGEDIILDPFSAGYTWTRNYFLKDPKNAMRELSMEGHRILGRLNKQGRVREIHKSLYEQLEIGEYKTFEIDNTLQETLLKTKNKIFYRRSPFPKIFLETCIIFKESLKLKKQKKDLPVTETGYRRIYGISLLDQGQRKEYMSEIDPGQVILNEENLTYSLIVDCQNLNLPSHSLFSLKDNIEFPQLFSKKEMNVIRQFVCNFLDFLNHPDVETKVIKWYNNENRIKKGRLPIPDRVQINLKGKLYKYIYEDLPKQIHSSPSASFWVRGHYIHFWNKKRWKGIYSKDIDDLKKKGYQQDYDGTISKWILPYIKGKGILLSKKYKLNSETIEQQKL